MSDFDSISIADRQSEGPENAPEALMGLRGVKVWMCVLGCRSNLYDGDAIAGDLAARGAAVSERPEGCRVAVIVSCSVTAVADKKCRQAVRRARRELDKNGTKGIVAVCGCWAQGLDAQEAKELGVDILAGSRRKSALPEALEALVIDPPSRAELFDMRQNSDSRTWDPLTLNRPFLRTRAFLKVQEGCDHFCSYCVIPFLRGRSVSRPLDDVLSEARRVAEAGCQEIVLTGIHLGTYGQDRGSSLAELVRRVSGIPGLARLRLGSLEPFALDGDLLEALASSSLFCPHLHLPLQSGDDEILSRMRRGYTADAFSRICDEARRKLGDELHISSDVLVAFPGESEGAFRATLALMERVGLGRVHVFPYSPRKGTLAVGFPDRVPSRAAAERMRAAMAAGEESLARYASRFVGSDLSVLIEGPGDEKGTFTGYTRNFISAKVGLDEGEKEKEEKPRAGREVLARMTDCVKGELRGYRC
ncbi:MAG: MiaB/RimO family radical SAM methylthiotransferase [Synergistaceae bacterium]|nr:MiaB/RimO family radical SAM methylthiotransferase [Synergistaceae bacterium]